LVLLGQAKSTNLEPGFNLLDTGKTGVPHFTKQVHDYPGVFFLQEAQIFLPDEHTIDFKMTLILLYICISHKTI